MEISPQKTLELIANLEVMSELERKGVPRQVIDIWYMRLTSDEKDVVKVYSEFKTTLFKGVAAAAKETNQRALDEARYRLWRLLDLQATTNPWRWQLKMSLYRKDFLNGR